MHPFQKSSFFPFCQPEASAELRAAVSTPAHRHMLIIMAWGSTWNTNGTGRPYDRPTCQSSRRTKLPVDDGVDQDNRPIVVCPGQLRADLSRHDPAVDPHPDVPGRAAT